MTIDIPICQACGKPRYQKHAETCTGISVIEVARIIVGDGAWTDSDAVRVARALLDREATG